MLLLIDAGNTRIKWALVDEAMAGAPWLVTGSVAHAQFDQLEQDWRGLGFAQALIANVAGAALAERLRSALPATVTIDWFASSASRAGVRNRYREPTQLGCDRFASAIGAHALLPDTALIIATCGTATTVDALSADGQFLGGMILPGLGLMASSLAQNTAQLPQVAQGLRIDQPFADHTDAAIASGCLAAQAGAIERAFAAHGRQGPARCILSGGAAPLIAPHLSIEHRVIENLVLVGLHTVATSSSC